MVRLRLVLAALRHCFVNITLVRADAAYAGPLVTWATTRLRLGLQIVRKIVGQTTFQPLPRRWVVEHAISWINRNRRTVRDCERHPNTTPP